MPEDQKKVDLVLEGGGVRGIALLGAVLRLYDEGYRSPRVAGTSAGAIVAALEAAYQRAAVTCTISRKCCVASRCWSSSKNPCCSE